MGSKHQNAWADFADWINDDGFIALVVLFCLVFFFIVWACSGTFFGALLLTVLGSFFIGGIPVLLIGIVATILSRDK